MPHMRASVKLLGFCVVPAVVAVGLTSALGPAANDSFLVKVTVNASQPVGPFNDSWRFFGADEPNYATKRNGKKLLAELGSLRPNDVYFRAHNLLTSGDGTPALKWGSTNAYTEDASGSPVYDWTIMDRIFDAYVEAGHVPLVQIGFTPQALSDYEGPYQHSWQPEQATTTIPTGWASPPNDLGKWGALVEA